MSSSMKSLLFWVVLVTVGVLVWNLSTSFQTRHTSVTFSDFVRRVDAGQVESVTIAGNEITGTSTTGENFHTYAPLQYEGLANRLILLR